MTVATLDGRAFEPAPLRPSWLRPAVIALVVALHAAALSIVYLEPPKPLELPREVIVDIEPQSAPAEAPAPPADEPKPPEKPAAAPPPPPPPEPQPPVAEQPPPLRPPPIVEEPALAPKPQPPVAEQPPLEAQPPLPPVEAPSPPPAPVELAPPKPPPPRRIEPRPKAEPVRQRPEPRRTTASRETGRPEASPSRSAPASAASQSAYVSEISGAIRSRLFYPPAARARGARGMVGVAFTIGASGAVTSFSITRSSGDRDLDAAARILVHSVRFPPPPGGSVHIATSFNYEPR